MIGGPEYYNTSNNMMFEDEFYEEDMTIWIDPLDGTKGFTEGHLAHITGMIGVSVNQRPKIGVIHKPFYNAAYRQGRTYFGTPETGVFIKDKFPKKLRRLDRVISLDDFDKEEAVDEKDYDLWVCASLNKNQLSTNEILKALKPRHVARVAGAGNKFVYLMDKKADFYVNLVPGFKYWDLCASEALYNSMGGILTNAAGEEILYDHNNDDYTIKEGIVAAKNQKVYDTCTTRLQNELNLSMAEMHERTLE
mmetsp:Transcript_40396/g.29101  ORF Transcript_40396/g.29101 Transcript_40396/m.29101 type:complete len:250 (+) Transcript_40396:405-1154(+)